MTKNSISRPHGKSRGFTLVELMISMTIGLLIVSGMLALFGNLSRNNGELSKTNGVIENGRFALQLLESDIMHAGFWGGYIPRFDDLRYKEVPSTNGHVPTAVPDPCLAYDVATWTDAYKTNLIGIPIQAYEVPSAPGVPPIPVCADATLGPVLNPKPQTDVLVVRYAQKCGDDCLRVSPTTAGPLYFQMQRCGTTLPTPGYKIAQTSLDMQEMNCQAAAPSEMRLLTSNIYFIQDINGIPTLMRSRFGMKSGLPAYENAEALIEGIEGFRVEFSLDNRSDTNDPVKFDEAIVWADSTNLTSPKNRGDGQPDGATLRCTNAVPCTAAQLMNAVAVKVSVLVRSTQGSPGYTDTKTYNLGGTQLGPYNDNIKRHVFTQSIRLHNVASRRETP